jgi:photosystem II stability/assembly factor-like uncharacterized protein
LKFKLGTKKKAPSLIASLTLMGLMVLTANAPVYGQEWKPMGPTGGDVRTLTSDPARPGRVYMGTTDGHIFESEDGGEHWKILGRAGKNLESVVTALVVDPRDSRQLFASTWTRDEKSEGGGVFVSHDAGLNWDHTGLGGQAVRALVQSRSDPDTLVAATLDGVYRTKDGGKTWERISPKSNGELKNFDSLAIDPQNPSVIYAGTFHLPWKTTDGGVHWISIHAGMIDDSDVLSLVIDSKNSKRVYASACSGIYRSENSGAGWQKIQGIPFSARRTYAIRQDPYNPQIFYAGTTEGLWQSRDAGARWQRITSPDWVINTLALAPGPTEKMGRVIVGTDQLGVLISDDGGEHFRAANDGFYHRHIVSVALDREHPGRVLAVLANAPEPVLATEDGGKTWAPLGPGLRMEGMKRVYASPDGWWASLERGGLMRYDRKKGVWERAGMLVGPAAAASAGKQKSGRNTTVASKPGQLNQVVNDMAFSHGTWFAATEEGLLASHDQGATWAYFPFAPLNLPVSSVGASADGQTLRIVSLRGMVFSFDGGSTWSWHDLPFDAGGAQRLDIADPQTLLASAGTALYVSRDGGKKWSKVTSGLPEAPVVDLALAGTVWLASMQTGGLYVSSDQGRDWSRVQGTLAEGHFLVVSPGDTPGVIYAASSTEGLYAIELVAGGDAVAHAAAGIR